MENKKNLYNTDFGDYDFQAELKKNPELAEVKPVGKEKVNTSDVRSISMTKYESLYNKNLTSEEFKDGLNTIQHNVEQLAKDNNVYDKLAKDNNISNIFNKLRGIYNKEYADASFKELGIGDTSESKYDELLMSIGIDGGTRRMYDISDLLDTLYGNTVRFAIENNITGEYVASDIKPSIWELSRKL